jgi:hypothetical protein
MILSVQRDAERGETRTGIVAGRASVATRRFVLP